MNPNGRQALAMSGDEVANFLAEGRRAQVATLDGTGGIDLVPMAYLIWEGRFALWTDPRSKKIRNLRRNPSITVLVEDGQRFEEFRAVQLQGHAEVLEDLEFSRRAGEILFGRHAPGGITDDLRAAAAGLAGDRVLVVVHADRVISWDHRKLGGVTPAEIGH